MKVYGFLYTSCIFESAASAISLHKTKAGAYRAMRKHKVDEYNSYRNMQLESGHVGFKFGEDELWLIKEFEVLE